MRARSVISVSGVGAATLGWCGRFAEALDARGVPVSWLVDPGAAGPIRGWLAERAAGGDVLVTSPDARFAGLPAHEAGLLLLAARGAMEAARLRSEVFAARGWSASGGSLVALGRDGFRLCARRADVVDVRSGDVTDARLIEPGLGFAARVDRTARRGGLVRLDVPAGGELAPALRAVDVGLARGAEPVTYAGLVTPRSAFPVRAR